MRLIRCSWNGIKPIRKYEKSRKCISSLLACLSFNYCWTHIRSWTSLPPFADLPTILAGSAARHRHIAFRARSLIPACTNLSTISTGMHCMISTLAWTHFSLTYLVCSNSIPSLCKSANNLDIHSLYSFPIWPPTDFSTVMYQNNWIPMCVSATARCRGRRKGVKHSPPMRGTHASMSRIFLYMLIPQPGEMVWHVHLSMQRTLIRKVLLCAQVHIVATTRSTHNTYSPLDA